MNAKKLKSCRKSALNVNNKQFCSPVSYLLNLKRFVSTEELPLLNICKSAKPTSQLILDEKAYAEKMR